MSSQTMRGPQGKTQRAKILRLLVDAHGAWVPLYEILPLAAQYCARINELRAKGFKIENKTEPRDGVRHSWYRLLSDTPQAPKSEIDWKERLRSLTEKGNQPLPDFELKP
jgi:hypothetical protein